MIISQTLLKLYLVYIQVVKNTVSLRKVTVMFIVTVNISIFQYYIYIYYLVKMELKSKLSQKLSIVKCIRKSQTCFKYKLIVTVNISRSSF